MLDKIEYTIAEKLAEHHLYPYGKEIYVNIFKKFSHFPLRLKELGIKEQGDTIIFIALVIRHCFGKEKTEFLSFYKTVLNELKTTSVTKLRDNLSVETFLGCILYYYHPVNVKNILNSIEVEGLFNSKEKYEYEIKKQTVLLFAI